MITESTLYWITRLDHFRSFLGGLSVTFGVFVIIAVIAFVIVGIVYLNAWSGAVHPETNEDVIAAKRCLKFTTWFTLACVFLSLTVEFASAFVPSTKEYCAIRVIPAAINNEDVRKFGNEFRELAFDWMNGMKAEARAKAKASQEAEAKAKEK